MHPVFNSMYILITQLLCRGFALQCSSQSIVRDNFARAYLKLIASARAAVVNKLVDDLESEFFVLSSPAGI